MSSPTRRRSDHSGSTDHQVTLLLSSSSSSDADAINVNRREVDKNDGSHCLHLDDASHLGCVIGNIGAQPATSAWRTALSIAMIAPRRSGHARSIAEIERYLRWQPCFAENTGLSMSAVAIRSVLNTGLQFFHFRPLGNVPGVAARHWRFAPDDIEAVRSAFEPALMAADAALNASERAPNVHAATRRIARRWPGAVQWRHAPTNHEYLMQCEELLDTLLDDGPRATFLAPRRGVAATGEELPLLFTRRRAGADDDDAADDESAADTRDEHADDESAAFTERHNRAPVEMDRDLDALESVEDAFSDDDEIVVTTMTQSASRVRVLARSLVPPDASEDDDDDDSDDDDDDNAPFTWRPIQLTKRRRM